MPSWVPILELPAPCSAPRPSPCRCNGRRACSFAETHPCANRTPSIGCGARIRAQNVAGRCLSVASRMAAWAGSFRPGLGSSPSLPSSERASGLGVLSRGAAARVPNAPHRGPRAGWGGSGMPGKGQANPRQSGAYLPLLRGALGPTVETRPGGSLVCLQTGCIE